MTRDILHISTQVLPGNKIQIANPELNVGEVVEVLILAKTTQNHQDKNESEPLIGLFKSSGSSLLFMLNQQTRCQDNILLTQKF